MTALPPDPVHLRRQDTNERFVAFAFAGAEIMAEAAPDGTITYATGAFRSRFGRPPESFIGTKLSRMIAQADHEAVEMALAMLVQRSRLMPMMVRLANAARTPLALAGILLPAPGQQPRLCLTFARPPEQAAAVLRPGTAQGFGRTAVAGLRAGNCTEILLLEIFSDGEPEAVDGAVFAQALEQVAPNAQASELAPGRYGVLEGPGVHDGTGFDSRALESALRVQRADVSVFATRLSLTSNGLTPPQAARALQHALAAFARDGLRGLTDAGLDSDLSGYMQRAGRKADILRRVMREGLFGLSFQPIVSLDGRVLHHYEALIRPKPIPELPLSGPQEFVMLVEALGLADELDLRVAKMACDRAAAAQLSVGFNISGQSAQNSAFRDKLVSLLRDHLACRAGLIIVEMTETAEIDDVGEALATAEALRKIGVPFCLDDFGAGAADLRLLRALTPNIVKLDGSYIPGIATDGRERAFIGGMVEIARAVGADVVAERIETETEAEALAALGVQYGQGWLFGRPADLPHRGPRASARAEATESWE